MITIGTKIRYKFGLIIAWGARALWTGKTDAAGKRTTRHPHIFFITSTINPSSCHLGENVMHLRSVYSADQRLEQTLQTVDSIRRRIPKALVLLLENSKLSVAQQAAFERACDRVVSFADDEVAAMLRDGPNKGAGEVYMLMKAAEILREYDFNILFKISGRYQLSDRFDIGRFPVDRFGFLKVGGVVSTRLYSVPAKLIGLYGRQLWACSIAARFGISIEDVISRGLSALEVHAVSPLGVTGPLAVDSGVMIDE